MQKRSMSVMRVQGRVRDVSRAAKQVQWLNALLAYAELFNQPGLEVNPELERVRTVPASRWRSHRLLLDACAALLCRVARPEVERLRHRAWASIKAGASFEAVEGSLGEYQTLDAQRLVESCPFFLGDAVANTYWQGWAHESEEEPASTLSARLLALWDANPWQEVSGARSMVVVVGHSLVDEAAHSVALTSGGGELAALEVCYTFWTEPLAAPEADGAFAITKQTVVDAIPLTAGRAAWAVGVRVVESDTFDAEEAEQALGAAAELIALLAPGQCEAAEQPWQLPAMVAAQLVQESVSAVLEAFVALGSAVYETRWRSNEPSCIYDSKYLYAVCPASDPRTLSLRAGRYETALEVAVGSEPVSMQNPVTRGDSPENRGQRPRWSMLRLQPAKVDAKVRA